MTNPLQQYFRQPKIFISLPSLGKYNTSESITGDIQKMPVYGMNGADQIIAKTPDALLNGISTIKIIESCCPNIIDASKINTIDINLILSAIRIATYGNIKSITRLCTNCNHENTYDIDIGNYIEHFKQSKFDPKIVVGDLIIMLKPLTYAQTTEFSLENFGLQKQLVQLNEIEDLDVKQTHVTRIFNEFAALQSKVMVASIEEIITPGSIVSEYGYIKEFIDNCDQMIINDIRMRLDQNSQVLKTPEHQVCCENCQHIDSVELDLDQSSFFDKA